METESNAKRFPALSLQRTNISKTRGDVLHITRVRPTFKMTATTTSFILYRSITVVT